MGIVRFCETSPEIALTPQNPFNQLFETIGQDSSACTDAINSEAYERVRDILEQAFARQRGAQILLKAPRAGFGKTHLIQRLSQSFSDVSFVPISLVGGQRLTAHSVTEEVVTYLLSPLPAGGGLTHLDLITRRVFAASLIPLVSAGEVPCDDRETAVQALKNAPVESFDFHHEQALTAHWAWENFPVLGPRLALQAARIYGTSQRDANFWVQQLFEYATTSTNLPLRNTDLIQRVAEAYDSTSEVTGMERLSALLALVTGHSGVVLVIDETEALSSSPSEGLALAGFIQSLRQHAVRASVILSVNGDVWETGFQPRLPGGLKDRLCENVVSLKPMTESEVRTLVSERGGRHSEKIIDGVLELDGVWYARRVTRRAGELWADLEQAAETEEESGAQSEQTHRSESGADGGMEAVTPMPSGSSTLGSLATERERAIATAAALSQAVAQLADKPEGQSATSAQSTDANKGQPADLKEENLQPANTAEASSSPNPEPLPANFSAAPQPQQQPEIPATVPFQPVAETEAPSADIPSSPADQAPVAPPAAQPSPFSVAPEPTRAPDPTAAPPIVSPFTIVPEPVEPLQAQNEPAPAASSIASTPVPAPEPLEKVTEQDQLKVDELLRQFRERYQPPPQP